MNFYKKISLLFFLIFSTACTRSPELVWIFKTGGRVYSSPALTSESLLVGSWDHHLYSLDLKTGKPKWKFNIGDRILEGPLVEGQTIYLGSAGGELVKINLNAAAPHWKFKTNSYIDYTPCADEDAVYFGGKNEWFYKVSKETGQKIWAYKTGFRMQGTCRIYKDLVLTSSWDEHYYAFNRHTGKVAWKIHTGYYNYGSPELYGDSVYLGTHDKLIWVDAPTGKVKSLLKVDYLDHPFVFQNYLWTNDYTVRKRNLDGRVLSGVYVNASPEVRPAGWKNQIIVSAQPRFLYGISTDLKVLWKYVGRDFFWAMGVVHDGIYYAGNRDGSVYALRLPS